MFASGLYMLFGRLGDLYASKVVMIVWSNPRLGSPAAAFESDRLIAFGFPPDSVFIWNRTWLGSPSGRSAVSTSPRHWATPAPNLPVYLAFEPPPPNRPSSFCTARCTRVFG